MEVRVLLLITMWVLASALVSLVVGYCIGRAARANQREAKAALKTLLDVLRAVEELTSDVGTRNSEMNEVWRHVGDLRTSGELDSVRQKLLTLVTAVLQSNQRLEEDLGYARSRMMEQAQELDRTRREAHTDSLTSTYNRKAFDERLRTLLTTFKRHKEPFVLIMADMDHFKWINDTHGHQAGDRVLTQLGHSLNKWLRDCDTVARYGGDEFAMLLPRTNMVDGRAMADRLQALITRSNFGVGTATEQASVSVSLGVAAVCDGDTSESLIERADQALFRSKRGGRNQVQSHDPSVEPGSAASALSARA